MACAEDDGSTPPTHKGYCMREAEVFFKAYILFKLVYNVLRYFK